MNFPLFRQQALNAQSSQFSGRVVLLSPVPAKLAAVISIIILSIILIFLFTGKYTRKVHISGQIMPASGIITAISPQIGRVISRSVEQGDFVHQGDLLFEISSERSIQGGDADQKISNSFSERRVLLERELSFETSQLEQHIQMTDKKYKLSQAEISHLEQELQIQKKRTETVKTTYSRYHSLQEKGFISEYQLSQYESDLSEQQARSITLERAILNAHSNALELKDEIERTEGQIHLIEAQNARSIATLEQEAADHQGRSRLKILAGVSGVISSIDVMEGQAVGPGTPLASIIPEGSKLEARLFVPSSAIGFVEPKQNVLLRLKAFPHEKFGSVNGIVKRVERSPVSQEQRLLASPDYANDSIYLVIIELEKQSITAYGRNHSFQAGMALDADIKQDSRRLVDFILDPILSTAKIKNM